MSVVKLVMRLPNQSTPQSPLSKEGGFSPMTPIEAESPFSPQSNSTTDTSELPENLEKFFIKNSSGCKWFSYDVMKTSTLKFSSDKLIGKGGCTCVYKGILPDGKPVAVKVLKSSKESWKDFTQVVDVLIGVCVEDNALISVYDLLPKGNLEENLHGNSKEKSVLSWQVRCKVAVGIAEALNYLHYECSTPVIHRDVKSSNILLLDEFEPKLSDFGLATWGPSDSSFLTDNDVVVTFQNLAPEYFMYGKVNEKINAYSFGVVLLELLSARKPISSESTKGQESLVMWARPKLESGDLRSILDPNLDGNIDEVQIQRMALAVRFCLIRSARLHPKMRQILNILKGDKDVEEFVKSQFGDRRGTENEENTDDEVYPHSSTESHLTLVLLDMEDTSTSFSSGEPSSGTSSEEYLKGRWSRSSSLD
ncbi:protein kinase STUNTED-like [Rhododendron vialii]|uniref:protein kinase STUNTED-like n=1 Tax=Rhododendron vialii TaxID=182163 RepID=UPI00265F7C7B|nr:protein kinase STUNTED-like [Rhododendron vialii]